MWASRFVARSPGTVGLQSGSCSSARVFAPRFFQTSPRGSVLALRYHFASIRLGRGLSPPSDRTCSAHNKKGGPATRDRPLCLPPDFAPNHACSASHSPPDNSKGAHLGRVEGRATRLGCPKITRASKVQRMLARPLRIA